MCTHGEHLCLKFLCLTLWQEEVCIDANNVNDTNNEANNDNTHGQSMIVQGLLVDKPNEPKSLTFSFTIYVSIISVAQFYTDIKINCFILSML